MLPLKTLGLLILMILLCDAEGLCPVDLNPLTLDPPEIIGQYGTWQRVSCRSTADHSGMYWTAGNETSDTTEDSDVVSWEVHLRDWDVKAQCNIKLNATGECSKELQITVYKNPDYVTLYAVQQNLLQCDVRNVAPVEKLSVTWYKDNHIIKVNNFTNATVPPVNASSTLPVGRGDHGAQIRCEAQLHLGTDGPQLPAVSSGVHNVSVHYAPETENDEDIDVEENSNVTLSCKADGNPPPVFHWTYDDMNKSENTSDLFIERVRINETYKCTATNYLGSVTRLIRVHVTTTTNAPAAITPAPSGCPLKMSPAELVVRYGDGAEVNCSTESTDVQGMGWEAPVGGTGLLLGSHVLWVVDKMDGWTIHPLCYANFKKRPQCAVSPSITIYKTPDVVRIHALHDGPVAEGTEYQLTCDVIEVAPARSLSVKWYKGNEIVHTDTFNETAATPLNVSSTLRLTPDRDSNGIQVTCSAELHLRPHGPEENPCVSSLPYVPLVHYKPRIQECPGSYAGVEHKMTLNMVPCRADGNPPPTVYWYSQGTLMNASEPLTRTQSGKYTLKAVNALGNISASVDVTVEYSPSFTCNDHYDVEEYRNHQTTCEPDGKPTPVTTWFRDGEEVTPPQSWTKHDGGEFFLRATNNHGAANHTLHIDILYAPVFKAGNLSREVSPGENVTLNCSADGHPAPEVLWKYPPAANVAEAARGSQRNVSVTGATSTNAGVYCCVAKNKVGSVSRYVKLTVKELTSRFSAAHIAVISVFVIMLLVILFLIFVNIIRRRGHYSFISSAADGSAIPLNTTSAGRTGSDLELS